MSAQEAKKTPAKDVVSPDKERKADLDEKVDKFAKKVTTTKLKIGLKKMRTVTKAARVKRKQIYTEGQKFAKKLKEETIVEKLEP